MNAPSLETPGIDTRLARELLDRGRVDYPTLAGILEEVRRGRGAGEGPTLARSLCQRGVLPEAELAGWVERVVGPGAASGQSWSVGGQIAGLEILRSLGAGGMGAVHLARDLRTGAEVAVKTLTLGEDEELGVRFQREAEAQARVGTHPHVVAVHRSGVAGGRAYLVMDVARGGDLATRIREAPLPPREAAEIIRALAAGLGHAHACGVLHRDLKPANVLFDEHGAACLTDFGLARLAGAEDLTQTGQILGTPAFMAPEQACAEVVDERTDVYGLGAILFAALTGRPPFVGASVLVLLAEVSEGGAPRVRSLRPEVPAALARICERCLAKDPAQRFPSARALEEDLEAFLAGRAPAGGRSKLGLVALGVLTLGLLVGGGLAGPADSPRATLAPRKKAPIPVLSREEVEVSGDLAELYQSLERGLRPLGAREVDAALSVGKPPRWLLRASGAPFFDLAWTEAIGVRDLGQALLVWSREETRVYDLWTRAVRWQWSGYLAALAEDRSRALVVEGARVRVVDLAYGGELRAWEIPEGIQQARFLSPSVILIARKHREDVELCTLKLTELAPERICVVEGLKDFVLTRRGLVYGWWDDARGEGGFAARALGKLAGKDTWRRTSLGDGAPAILAVLEPARERVALGTTAGRIQVLGCDPAPREKPVELRREGLAGAAGARFDAARLGWVRPDLLLAAGKNSLGVWREGEGFWRLERELELKGLRDFDLGSEGRRLLAVSGRHVTQRLLSGYLPELASGAPFFQTSERVRLILACAEARAGERDPGRKELERERARAGFSYALACLDLTPALRDKVQRSLGDLGPRRPYEPGKNPFGAGRDPAEQAGALDDVLTKYLSYLPESPLRPTNYLRLGRVLGQLGDFETALRYLDHAEALSQAHKDQEDVSGLLKRCQSNRDRVQDLRSRTEARLRR